MDTILHVCLCGGSFVAALNLNNRRYEGECSECGMLYYGVALSRLFMIRGSDYVFDQYAYVQDPNSDTIKFTLYQK